MLRSRIPRKGLKECACLQRGGSIEVVKSRVKFKSQSQSSDRSYIGKQQRPLNLMGSLHVCFSLTVSLAAACLDHADPRRCWWFLLAPHGHVASGCLLPPCVLMAQTHVMVLNLSHSRLTHSSHLCLAHASLTALSHSRLRCRDADACLARARAWFLACDNLETQPVTATFVLTGDSDTYPANPTQAWG